jgi:hypothetical protein
MPQDEQYSQPLMAAVTMIAASIGPAYAPRMRNISVGKPEPFLANSSGSTAIHAPAHARTKKAINGCRVIRLLSGEEVAGCDVVVMIDMICILLCRNILRQDGRDKAGVCLQNTPGYNTHFALQ